jgi:phytoene dehydrogenase-like protein
MTDHDAVVVGGGHNGLVCAAYLAGSGMDVLVVEARTTTGGCASTVDALGARVNICNCDHVLVRGTPIIEELRLTDHGLRYLDLVPHIAAVTWGDDAPWFAFHELESTLDSMAVGHADQVEGYRRWIEDALPVADLILGVTNDVPSLGRVVPGVLRRRGRGVMRMLRWNRMSAEQVLREYLTDEAVIAPILSTAPTVWGLAPDSPGTGLAAINFAMRHRIPPGRPVGGSGAFPDAVREALEAAGGTVRCGHAVDRILVSGGKVEGVRLAGGDVARAPVVVAAVDPYRVFVEWLDGAVAERQRWIGRADDAGYESKIDAVVTGSPRLRGFDDDLLARHSVRDPLIPTVHVAPRVSEMRSSHSLLAEGLVAERPVLYINVPSVLDASLRPADRADAHVVSLEILFTPYHLSGGWEDSAEPGRWLGLAGQKLEGFEESVVRWRHVGPTDYEQDFGLRNGYATSFSGGPVAALVGRDPELTRYRTSVSGLYLTGAATFPGAGVWGAPGRNAAHVILRERS